MAKTFQLNNKIFIFLLFYVFFVSMAFADTIVQGNVSGNWTKAGSPFLLIDNCTVPTGDALIIEPGVEVVIGESFSLNINGQIIAAGTEGQRIVFRAVNDNVQFNRVYVINGSSSPPTSGFEYCTFRNAGTELYLHAYGRIDNADTTMETHVSHCNFESTVTKAIYARAQAVDASQYLAPRRRHARINPVIASCNFNGNNAGIEIYTQGAGSAYYNCFFDNSSNFVGYPASYGDTVISNANGTPCDLGYNIHEAPLMVSETDAHLTQFSPCIDAGTSEDAPDVDSDGDTRPKFAGYDIGADEFFIITLFANAGIDQFVCNFLCSDVILDGRRSYATNSEITAYDWTVIRREDGSTVADLSGETLTITGLSAGVYGVTLTISAADGESATDTMVITVVDTCDPCAMMKGDLDADGDDLEIFSFYFGTVFSAP